MKIEFSHTCLVFEFIDIDFFSQKIYDSLLPKIKKIMSDNNLNMPEDWMLIFDVGYNNGIKPLVSKNKVGSYTSVKMKYIKVVIPIPLKFEIEWGVNPEQHLYKKEHYDKLMKNFWELNVDYRSYNNRTDYITACLKAGIKKSFEEGFTVGGTKIKTKTPIDL